MTRQYPQLQRRVRGLDPARTVLHARLVLHASCRGSPPQLMSSTVLKQRGFRADDGQRSDTCGSNTEWDYFYF